MNTIFSTKGMRVLFGAGLITLIVSLSVLTQFSAARADDQVDVTVSDQSTTVTPDTSTSVDVTPTTDTSVTPVDVVDGTTDTAADTTAVVVQDSTPTSDATADSTSATDSTSVTTDSSTADSSTADQSVGTDTATPAATTETAVSDSQTTQVNDVVPVVTLPELSTDKADYAPGETATIFGKFFQALQNIILTIFGGSADQGNYTQTNAAVTTDSQGAFSFLYTLDNVFRPLYTVTASDTSGNQLAQTTFTDAINLADNPDQCRQGGVATPQTWIQCITNPAGDTNKGWVNGNAGNSNAHYREGESISYRVKISGTGMSGHDVRLIIGYDTTKSSKRAIDYLTSNDRWQTPETTAGVTPDLPCDGITGCNSASEVTVAIPTPPSSINVTPTNNTISATNLTSCIGGNAGPLQPETSFNDLPSNEKVMKFYGVSGTPSLTYIGPSTDWSLTTDQTQQVQIIFHAAADTVVVSFGGHIANRDDWGCANGPQSAGGISGSPYHMHQDALAVDANNNGNFTDQHIGNQDLQLSAAAVVAAPTINTTPNPSSGNVGDTLNDSAVLTGGNSPSGTITFKLYPPSDATCAQTAVYTQTVSVSGGGATTTPGYVSIAEGTYHWTADYSGDTNNTAVSSVCSAEPVTLINPTGTLIVKKFVTNDNGGTATSSDFTLHVKSGATDVSGSPAAGLESGTTYTLNAGTYSVSENTPLTGYTNVTSDSNNGDCDASGNVTVVAGQTKTCTITNDDIAGTLKIVKNTVGGNGQFEFTITGPTASTPSITTLAGTGFVGPSNVNAGTYSVKETIPSGWDLTSASCNDGSSSFSVDTVSGIQVALAQNIVCTFNDTKKPKLTIVKVTDPTNDTGKFNLSINSTQYATDISNGGTTGAQFATIGVNTFAEAAGTGTSLTDYTSVVSGDGCGGTATAGTITLAAGDDKTCTITNTRKPRLTVNKVLVPSNDTGLFNLQIDSSTAGIGANVGNGGTTGAVVSTIGAHTVGETAGTGTSLSDYTSVISGDCASNGSITLAAGDNKTCTITNTKKGHITIKKVTVGGDGSFTFTGDVTGSLSNNQTATAQVVPGTYHSTEATKTGWDLTSIVCDDGDSTGVIGTGIATFSVAAGENVTCTFTNTKKPTLTVNKVLVPSNDTGLFNLQIDSSTAGTGANVSNGGTTGAVEVSIGSHTVGETAGTATDLSHYVTVISGDCASNGTVSLAAGENKTCTITNTRKATVIVKKVMVGGTEIFSFSGTPNGSISSNNGTISAEIAPGQATSTEGVVSGWALTNIACDDNNSTGNTSTRAVTFNAEPGETVTCTFTNNKPQAKISIAPLTAYNEIGHNHTATSTVMVNDGDGNYVNAADGTLITFSLLSNTTNATFVGGVNTCTTSGGSCSVIINATQTGSVDIHAAADPSELSITIHVETNSTGDNSANAHKTYENAQVTITGNSTNEIGTDHTFTVTVKKDIGDGAGLVAAQGETVSSGISGTGSITDGTCTSGTTDSSGQCTLIAHSTTPGVATVHASSTLLLNGVSITRATGDGLSGDSSDTHKTWVDANINITPETATNKIGDPHTLTSHVNINTGTGGFVNAPDGTEIDFAIVSGPGSLSASSCNTAGGTGSCSVILNATTTGTTIVNASTAVSVGGLTLNRSTGDSKIGDSANASKDWVDLQILIDQNSTNEINNSHTFTITVNEDLGDGSGFVPVSGATVTPGITGTGSLTGTGTCETGTTNSSGQCTIIVNSAGAGVGTVSASTIVSVNGVSITRSLGDTLSGDSAKGTKTWVDASIALSPLTATNNIGTAHTITATVMKNPGTGLVAASGVTVTFSLLNNTAGASFVGAINTCITNGSGQCTVQINSSTPGSVDINATTTFSVGGVSLTRASGDGLSGDSANANKVYVAGKILVMKQTLPDGSSQSFNFPNSYSSDFQLTDGQSNLSGYLAPGTYSVNEDSVAGWDLTSATCDNGTKTAIVVTADATTTCTFTNTQRGHLIVQKTTDPAADPTVFTIAASGTGAITGGGAGTVTDATDKDYEVTPGTYSVTETVPANWDKTGDTCQDVAVGPGETKYCELTNVKKGKITIVKDADPNDCQDFQFSMTGQSNFFLDDNDGVTDCTDTNRPQSQTFNNLPANNSYTAAEILPNQFWVLASINCTGASNYTTSTSTKNVVINLKPGEEVTCTFLNDKLSPTRTLGFWQTHTAYTSGVFADHPFYIGVNVTPALGTHKGTITNIQSTGQSQLFGGFYASIPKTTTGAKRSDVDKARMQLLQQLIAAKLNCAEFGCASSVQTMISAADAAYAGSSASAILASASALDGYNNSGDTLVIGNAGKATPKTSQSYANLIFWNTP